MGDAVEESGRRCAVLARAAELDPSVGTLAPLVAEELRLLQVSLEAECGARRGVDARNDAAVHRISQAESRKKELVAAIAARGEAERLIADYLEHWGRTYREMVWRRAVLERFKSYGPAESALADISVGLQAVSGWGDVTLSLTQSMSELEAKHTTLKTVSLPSVEPLHDQYREMCAAFTATAVSLARERNRRRQREESEGKFWKSQRKVRQWCRSQREALDALEQASHIHEFGASVESNVSVMETNFLVLMELAEPLLPSDPIRKGLLEVHGAWLDLCVSIYERLLGALQAEHRASGVEDCCRAWSSGYADDAHAFLSAAAEQISSSGGHSPRVPAVKAPVEEVKSLLRDFRVHNMLCDHIADFTLRETCTRLHYEAMRQAAFSRVSLLVRTFPCQLDYTQRAEFHGVLDEVTDWVNSMSPGGLWDELLARVEHLKGIVDRELSIHRSCGGA